MKGLMDIMKQASQMQQKMAEMQNAIDEMQATGTAGAGLVTVTLKGKFSLSEVKIDPSLLKEGEAEILEDLIVAAHADARTRIEEQIQAKMQEVTGGLQLPPGMKLPF